MHCPCTVISIPHRAVSMLMCVPSLPLVGGQRSPGVDPQQLAAELQKVSLQQFPGVTGAGPQSQGGLGVLSALERSTLLHSGPGSAASSGVPSPGQPGSPAISKKQRHNAKVRALNTPASQVRVFGKSG